MENNFLLDVRTPDEFSLNTLPGAVNIPLDELRDRLDELPKDKMIYTFCAVGLRDALLIAFWYSMDLKRYATFPED